MANSDLSEHARTVIDANSYMALGTADETGHPWVSPVWFASEDYRATVSEHSVLIAGRDPELGTGVDRREPVTPA